MQQDTRQSAVQMTRSLDGVMGRRRADDALDWLSDYVVTVLQSPTWVTPIAQFVDEGCVIFDDVEENLVEHTRCHQVYQQLVNDLLCSHLLEVSVTEEQFERFCDRGLDQHRQLHRTLAEQFFAVDDFLTFKAMMVKHNADLFREVVTFEFGEDEDVASSVPFKAGVSGIINMAVQNSIAQGLAGAEDEWRLYDSHFGQSMGAMRRTDDADFDADTREEALLRCEQAELEQAIALSLQIEEERLRHIAAGEEPASAFPQDGDSFLEDVLASALSAEAQPEEEVSGDGASCALSRRYSEDRLGPQSLAGPPRMVHVGPLNEAPGTFAKTWGFTSAPLVPFYGLPGEAPPDSMADVEPDNIGAEPVADLSGTGPRRLPGRAGFLSSPLCVVPPRPQVAYASPAPSEPLPPEPGVELGGSRRRSSAAEVDGMRCNLQLWRDRAEKALEPLSPKGVQPGRLSRAWSGGSHGATSGSGIIVTEEERLQRAEHLRRQRDRLIEKRSQDRERQMADFHWMPGAEQSGRFL
ncbi:unnamed protein product, partial [Polarella glacialis]